MEILKLKEAAEYLKIKPDTLRKLARKEEIKGFKISSGKNSSWRFNKHDLNVFISKRFRKKT